MLRVTVITVTFNRAHTIAQALESVANQSYPNIEHIVVDGKSSDNTLAVVNKFPHVSKVVSEEDDGLYDAINKGIRLGTGDVIGILHSDDFFTDENVIQRVVDGFEQKKVDVLFGDIQFVRSDDIEKVVRYYSGANWSPEKFISGFMPPHPSVYIRRECFDQLGLYRTDYTISADYELLVRYLYTAGLEYVYSPYCIVTMRAGGLSTKNLKNRWILNSEIIRACKAHGINSNWWRLLGKVIPKLKELK